MVLCLASLAEHPCALLWMGQRTWREGEGRGQEEREGGMTDICGL